MHSYMLFHNILHHIGGPALEDAAEVRLGPRRKGFVPLAGADFSSNSQIVATI